MPLLTVPNWSFGRQPSLLRQTKDFLEAQPVQIHFCESDPDHNRTVTAFSGNLEEIKVALLGLAELILPSIDLQRHVGVHPRIGGLDVCPFSWLVGEAPCDLQPWIESLASELADRFAIPIFLYEHSATAHGASRDLPSLRRGGFGGLLDRELEPDFGPKHAHPHLGATVLGVRDFLIAMNINVNSPDPSVAERVAAKIRALRREGDPRYAGVRALGFPLASRRMSQVSLNLTKPSHTPVDDLLPLITSQITEWGLQVAYPELIGVIRDVDMEHNTMLAARPEQIVQTGGN